MAGVSTSEAVIAHGLTTETARAYRWSRQHGRTYDPPRGHATTPTRLRLAPVVIMIVSSPSVARVGRRAQAMQRFRAGSRVAKLLDRRRGPSGRLSRRPRPRPDDENDEADGADEAEAAEATDYRRPPMPKNDRPGSVTQHRDRERQEGAIRKPSNRKS